MILRATLGNIETQIRDFNSVIRCHRAFIVNVDHIVKFTGNAQGLKLEIEYATDEVPVARNYVNEIKKRLSGD